MACLWAVTQLQANERTGLFQALPFASREPSVTPCLPEASRVIDAMGNSGLVRGALGSDTAWNLSILRRYDVPQVPPRPTSRLP